MEYHIKKNIDYRHEIEFANTLIELDVYRMLTILHSSESLHSVKPEPYGWMFLAWQFEQSEVYRIVFNLSISARNILDKTKIQNISTLIAGKLEEKNTVIDLTFREACNKIVHSEHINFDLINPTSVHDHEGLREFIYVYGKKGKNEWKATINLLQFADMIMRVHG